MAWRCALEGSELLLFQHSAVYVVERVHEVICAIERNGAHDGHNAPTKNVDRRRMNNDNKCNERYNNAK